MPPPRAVVDAYYTTQAATARAVTRALATVWTAQMGSDFDAGWERIREQVVAAVVAGQVRAAAAPQLYLDRLLQEAGVDAEADATLSPVAFAGWTATGVELEPVLQSSVTTAKQGVAAGLTTDAALTRGLARLTLLGATEVQDAGRGAMQSAMLLEPQVGGYVRYVRTPACGRCIVQAGKFFQTNAGFLRHPRCDCQHVPVVGRGRDRTFEQSPRELAAAMTAQQRVKAFTAAGAKALDEGADVSQVVNARSGMRTAADHFTKAGTTVRSSFGRAQTDLRKQQGDRIRSTGRKRLSPQGIAYFADGDRELYTRLLRDNGYL